MVDCVGNWVDVLKIAGYRIRNEVENEEKVDIRVSMKSVFLRCSNQSSDGQIYTVSDVPSTYQKETVNYYQFFSIHWS